MADAMLVAEGYAQAADPAALALRFDHTPDRVVVDLGRADGAAVVITPSGWQVVNPSPVLFRRSELTAELPIPTRGGSLDELAELLNVSAEAWPMVRAWMVAAPMVNMPRPILKLGGEQGAGKSTTARFVLGVLDPSPDPLHTPPRDVGEWAVVAAAGAVLGIDNVTSVPQWLSDALCRAVTGSGMTKRRLYSDAGLVILRIKRAVLLSTIDAGALRGDLADRLLPVEVERIANRRDEAELERLYNDRRPAICGALYGLISAALYVLPEVSVDNPPRMADFARVVAAVDDVCESAGLATYLEAVRNAAVEVVEGDAVAAAVATLVGGKGAWSGTALDLCEAARPEPAPKTWPSTGQAMAGRLRRAVVGLRSVGVEVAFTRGNGGRRIVTLVPVGSGDDGDVQGDDLGANGHIVTPIAPRTSPENPQVRGLQGHLGAFG